MRSRILICLLACTTAGAYAADVYKWTDASGVVHYSDTEPAAASNAQLLHVAGRITPETEAQRDARRDEQANAETPPTTGDAAKPAADDAQARCQRARSQLELLQSGTPVAMAGGSEPIDDAARQREISRAQITIARDCK